MTKSSTQPNSSTAAGWLSPVRAIGRATLGIARETGALALFAFDALRHLLTPPWYWRELGQQLIRIGYYSLPVVGLTAVFIGAALALNIYTGGARFNAEQFVPNIVVLGITRELGPVFAGLMLAGRVSAGIAAEIGAMRVSEQIDALRTLSVSPMRYLVVPRVAAAIITLPLLVIIADIIGVMGGYLVAVNSLGFNGAVYIRNTLEFMTFSDVGTGLIKAAVFGFIIALMGCRLGLTAQGGAMGVGRSTTLAVVSAAMLIFLANYLLTTLFVSLGL
jgi:phospholipid/cholesterol/gamma-HCH transport system permease protein